MILFKWKTIQKTHSVTLKMGQDQWTWYDSVKFDI